VNEKKEHERERKEGSRQESNWRSASGVSQQPKALNCGNVKDAKHDGGSAQRKALI
jgi:hypothetical protein